MEKMEKYRTRLLVDSFVSLISSCTRKYRSLNSLISNIHLSLSHEGKVLDDGLAHVLQPLELNLKGLQLGCLTHAVVVLSLDPVLGGEEHLVPGAPHVARHAGDEADLEHVVLVRREGELAIFLDVLPVDEVVARRVGHHHVNLEQKIINYKLQLTSSSYLLSLDLRDIKLPCHQDVFMDFLFQTFPEN